MASPAFADGRAGAREPRLREPLLVGAGTLATVAALHVRDPHQQGSWGFCPFRLLTGLPCPGCGSLRAVNDLTHGDVAAALGSNAVTVLLLGGAVVLWLTWVAKSARSERLMSPAAMARLAAVVGIAYLVFGIARLTPVGAWLQP